MTMMRFQGSKAPLSELELVGKNVYYIYSLKLSLRPTFAHNLGFLFTIWIVIIK